MDLNYSNTDLEILYSKWKSWDGESQVIYILMN